MKTTLLLTLLLATTAFGRTIPLEDFAQKSQFKSVQISPDGKHIAYTYEEGDRVKLGTMNLKTKKGIYSFDVGANREIIQFQWITNKRLYFVGGNITGWLDGAPKEYRAYFANLDGKKREGIPIQYSRIVSLMEDDDDYVLILKNQRDGVKVHKMNVKNLKTNYLADEPSTVGTNDSRIVDIVVDHNDEPRVAVEFDPVDEDNFDDDQIYFHAKKSGGEWKQVPFDNKRGVRPVIQDLGFNKDNSKFYFISDFDLEDMGAHGLFSYDFNNNKIELVFRHEDADVLGGVYSADNDLIGVSYEAGYPDYYYLEDESLQKEVAFHKSLRATFPNSDLSIGRYTKNKELTTLRVRSDQNPGDFYIFDRKNTKVNYLASSMPHIKPSEMAKIEPFKMAARDGLEMYGQLTLPPGKELKNLPMVVYPHGGPYGPRDFWAWRERPQLLANRGYLVLQLNFRGSGGYGSGFQDAGYHEWGAKMQDDITDATLWAIEKGYADKDRICIHGVSYGGYASMQAVVKEPDLYKCSIPDAGPYELEYQWKKADSFKQNKKAREWFLARMIGSTDEARVKERSPVYHLDKLKAPLLIVHGSEDVRVPIGNAYLLEEKLKEKGIKYETMYKKDGHGFQKIPYRIELYEKMLSFLEQHIGS
ncbi:alpha/beta hydrolase family protein [Marinicella sediminis]|uniref:Alpha/beta hydrolase family protein n=1 Tax=Marinicella sediminis TaxID=1792834 RepID=A0ABV7J4S0_9GAMM|nr:prolyl oligopeptidase family serine peptidase [Marinicella sediminis]